MQGSLIYEYGKNPSYYGKLKKKTVSHTEKNIQCGEFLSLDLLLDEEQKILNAGFEAECRIVGIASTSLLLEYMIDKKLDLVEKLDLDDIYSFLEIETLTEKRKNSALLGLLTLKNIYKLQKKQALLNLKDLLK
jgi:NifU-like protein involved in Fe-S cluster formation